MDHLQLDVSLFEDDARILNPVNNFDDITALQSDLDKLYTWQENNNNVKFNGNFFEVLKCCKLSNTRCCGPDRAQRMFKRFGDSNVC